MAKSRAVKRHREWARIATLEALGGTQFAHNGATIPVTIHVHAKPKGPLPDRDNIISSFKALGDGIADALKVNDRDFAAPKVVFADVRDGRFVVEIGGPA